MLAAQMRGPSDKDNFKVTHKKLAQTRAIKLNLG